MKRFTLAMLFCLAMAFAGCQTPPDRIALSTLNTGDAAVDAAYHAWLAGWKERRTHEGESTALLAERDRVAALVAHYQSAHRQVLHTAETALQATNGVAVLALDELSNLKGDLLNVLTHR